MKIHKNRLLIVGTGNIFRKHIGVINSLNNKFEIAGIVEKSAEKIRILKKQFSCKIFSNIEKAMKEIDYDLGCVLTDSGTVQEECSIFKIPVLTLRESTERPETQESGSNIIIGINSKDFIKALELSINSSKDNIKTPEEYLEENVSDKILKILLISHL